MTSIPRGSYADTPPDFHLISQNSENNDEEQGGSEYGGGLILTKGIFNCNFHVPRHCDINLPTNNQSIQGNRSLDSLGC